MESVGEQRKSRVGMNAKQAEHEDEHQTECTNIKACGNEIQWTSFEWCSQKECDHSQAVQQCESTTYRSPSFLDSQFRIFELQPREDETGYYEPFQYTRRACFCIDGCERLNLKNCDSRVTPNAIRPNARWRGSLAIPFITDTDIYEDTTLRAPNTSSSGQFSGIIVHRTTKSCYN